MARRRTRDKPLFEPMVAWFTAAYMSQSAWINEVMSSMWSRYIFKPLAFLLTQIKPWIYNHDDYIMWDVIIHPYPKFNCQFKMPNEISWQRGLFFFRHPMWELPIYIYGCNVTLSFNYTPRNEVEGGYTGFTLFVRPSVCLSVCLSVRPSVRPWVGVRMITLILFSGFKICFLHISLGSRSCMGLNISVLPH